MTYEPLGDRAPAVEITPARILRSANGLHTVVRRPDGGLDHETSLGAGAAWASVIMVDEAHSLERPGTALTWRYLEESGHSAWKLVLVDQQDEVCWIHRKGDVAGATPGVPVDPGAAEPPVRSGAPVVATGPYSSAWMDAGLDMEHVYCVTAIRDIDPDDALRRFGASADEISTSTWTDLQKRVAFEEAYGRHIVAAFAIGSHTLLVEDNGWRGANLPELSQGTFAVSSYCSINADTAFVVSRDGVVLAALDELAPSSAEGADPGILTEALAEMGITDPEAYDADETNFLEDLELLCRLVGVRPTVADVTGAARVAIFGDKDDD
ncbi:MAG: hypothetical protein JWQ81_70 [Amycolatopsis sp.]|uniref:DUF6461 domain-containing protein n=1 Tax=Amycolatopsis sp. TaxID=37632 RepID=UPI00262DAA48|nr:DUF6461 domain-containing protein [Amycolatopsis sp.]MCU1679331.1 hypothetical protein [Amycolatopsis sp.]